MKHELHSLMQEHLSSFEKRDTELLNMMEKAESMPALYDALCEARKQNLEFAIDDAKGLIGELEKNLEENVRVFILGGNEL